MKRREFFVSAAACGVLATLGGELSRGEGPAEASPVKINPLTPPKQGLINVAMAISSGTTEIDYVGPMAAFEVWHDDPATGKPAPRFKLYTVSHTREPVDGRIADYTFDTAPPPHIVVVPAQRGSDALLDWLRKVSKTTDVTMSVCTGARHLAKAGLLDGKTATSHHGFIKWLTKEYPKVKWVRGVRYVDEGHICTGGGLTAGIDLAIHIVERYFGRARAIKVAEYLEYEGRGWMNG